MYSSACLLRVRTLSRPEGLVEFASEDVMNSFSITIGVKRCVLVSTEPFPELPSSAAFLLAHELQELVWHEVSGVSSHHIEERYFLA